MSRYEDTPAGRLQRAFGALEQPGEIMAKARQVLARYPDEEPLIILDTFGKVKPPKRPSQESYQADYEAVGRLKETIDFRVEDAVIDVFEVPEQNRGGHGRMMYAVAARRSAIDRHAGALAAVPTFDVVDVPELCLRNLAALLPAASAGVALLQLGETAASVVLVRGKTFYFARQMDLQATLHIAGDSSRRLDAGSVVLELQRSLDYYERHFDQPPITRIAVSPAGTRASELALDLGRETGFEVTTLDLNVLLSCASPIEPATQAACLLAVGAALREEHRSL